MKMKETLWKLRKKLLCSNNLIHCITNPISINDCANAVLAVGGKPIMAQHPGECEQITYSSKALALNLGNFDDIRALAMMRSSLVAHKESIPMILDLVGVGCSNLRKDYALKIIKISKPNILKGNLSEIKEIAGKNSHALGIDVGEEDKETYEESAKWICELAKSLNCTIICTGKTDIISNGEKIVLVHNGHEMMSMLTGTGCMLNVLCAAYMSCGDVFSAAIFSTAFFGIVGEKSQEEMKTLGGFHMGIFDWLYGCTEEEWNKRVNIEEIQI